MKENNKTFCIIEKESGANVECIKCWNVEFMSGRWYVWWTTDGKNIVYKTITPNKKYWYNIM